MIKSKGRKIKQFKSLTKKDKDRICDFITKTGMAISKAQFELGVTSATINKVFEERFNKRENNQMQLIEDLKLQIDNIKKVNN
tara:strand:+ start:68 stop:316 length:249 start_codon:yes stop_codon:yes gene_type:complete